MDRNANKEILERETHKHFLFLNQGQLQKTHTSLILILKLSSCLQRNVGNLKRPQLLTDDPFGPLDSVLRAYVVCTTLRSPDPHKGDWKVRQPVEEEQLQQKLHILGVRILKKKNITEREKTRKIGKERWHILICKGRWHILFCKERWHALICKDRWHAGA